jgi:hypothetical protein
LKKAFGVKARRRKSASRRRGLRLEYLVFEEGRAARGIIARALGSGIIRIKKFLLRDRYKKKKHKPSRERDERREKQRKGTTEDAPSERIEVSRDLKLVLVRIGRASGATVSSVEYRFLFFSGVNK